MKVYHALAGELYSYQGVIQPLPCVPLSVSCSFPRKVPISMIASQDLTGSMKPPAGMQGNAALA